VVKIKLGRTGLDITPVVYGGIVSMGDGQTASDRYVNWAIDQGINYFDVAPSYGDAQEKLGNSLVPYRKDVFLACKTGKRDRVGAEKEFEESKELLHTDHFDVYQLHALTTDEDIDLAFGPGGVMEMVKAKKASGEIKNVGFSAHSEKASLRALDLYDFDTILFPFNWFMMMEHGFGAKLIQRAKERDMGILCLKPLIERKWKNDEERRASAFPKSWCKPIDTGDAQFGKIAMKYALSLGVHTIVPPGNFESFKFAVDSIEECLSNPLSSYEINYLKAKLDTVRGMEFFEV
jgi:aryl-alcohol dehydrogenase-like predicted oxidoreductase